jgi:uncharacterized protein (TIRG00374 family)
MKYKKFLPIIGIIVLIYILSSLDFQKIYYVFSNINPVYTFISFFAIVPLILIVNIEWQILLKKQKINVSFIYSLKNILIGYFYGFITPGGLGAYTRALYLENESKSRLGKCLSNIIIFNTIDYISLLVLGLIGAFFLGSYYPNLIYFIIILIIIVFISILVIFKKEISKSLFTKLVKSRIFTNVKDKLNGSIDSFYEDIPRFIDVLIPFFISISSWIFSFFEFYLLSKLFLIDIPFLQFILILAVANLIASIPITVYGLGTREATLITIFSIYGVVPEKVLALSLFWFTIVWLIPSIFGAVVTSFETKKFSEFKFTKKNIGKFSDYMKKYPKIYLYLASIVKNNIDKSVKKPVIVDLGTGPGLLSLEISNLVPNSVVFGIDLSKDMIKKACENAEKSGFTLVNGTSNSLPFKECSVDVVVSRFSLIYWENPKRSLCEIYRVLKPDGKLIFEEINRDFPKWRLSLIKIHMFVNNAGLDTIRYHSDAFEIAYNVSQLKELLTDSNFKIIYEEINDRDWRFIVIGEKG